MSTSTIEPHAGSEFDPFSRLVEKLISDPALCAWCFAKRRQLHKEYDESREQYFQDHGKNSTLQVVSATSSPDPSTYSEVVPPKMRDGEPWLIEEPARPRCICGDCANIDIDLDNARGNGTLVTAARNMVAYLNAEYDRALDREAAADYVKERVDAGERGPDKDLLAAALRAGFEA